MTCIFIDKQTDSAPTGANWAPGNREPTAGAVGYRMSPLRGFEGQEIVKRH